MIFALCGAHRTGKTTLAEKFAKEIGAEFLSVSVSKLQKEIGFNSAKQDYSFDERMRVQEYLINRLDDIYEANYGTDIVSDRSPIDLMAYALVNAGPNLTEYQSARLKRYLDRCVEVANIHCVGVLLIQPGVPLIKDEKSGPCSEGFIEHLNAVIFGLINSDNMEDVPAFYVPRHIVDLEKRVAICKNALSRSMVRNESRKRVFNWNKSNAAFFSPSTAMQ